MMQQLLVTCRLKVINVSYTLHHHPSYTVYLHVTRGGRNKGSSLKIMNGLHLHCAFNRTQRDGRRIELLQRLSYYENF